MLEHPQIPISHEQNRAKLVMQSTVFRSECLELSAIELEKLNNLLSLHSISFCKTFQYNSWFSTTLEKKAFENIAKKKKQQHFSRFAKCCLPYKRNNCTILSNTEFVVFRCF